MFSQLIIAGRGAIIIHQTTSCNCHIFAIQATKNILRDSRDTRPYLHRVQEQLWSFNRPYRAPKLDLMVFENILGRVYQFYIFYSVTPLIMLGHFFRHFPTLKWLRGPSWTFMEPKMCPELDPERLILGHPW